MPVMYSHYCEVLHGGPYTALVKIRPAKTADRDNMVSGRVVSIDSNGDFALGLANTKVMPLFVLRGTEVPSVYYPGGKTGTLYDWVPMSGDASNVVALVGSGAFELQSTEFDPDGTYTPNTLLTADANGKLKVATFGTDLVLGVCSVHEAKQNYMANWTTGQPARGTNAQGVEVVTFWTVWHPV